MRHAARGGDRTDVDQELDPVLVQQLDQLVQRAGGVPDGQEPGQLIALGGDDRGHQHPLLVLHAVDLERT